MRAQPEARGQEEQQHAPLAWHRAVPEQVPCREEAPSESSRRRMRGVAMAQSLMALAARSGGTLAAAPTALAALQHSLSADLLAATTTTSYSTHSGTRHLLMGHSAQQQHHQHVAGERCRPHDAPLPTRCRLGRGGAHADATGVGAALRHSTRCCCTCGARRANKRLAAGPRQPAAASARHVHPDAADAQPAQPHVCARAESHGGEAQARRERGCLHLLAAGAGGDAGDERALAVPGRTSVGSPFAPRAYAWRRAAATSSPTRAPAWSPRWPSASLASTASPRSSLALTSSPSPSRCEQLAPCALVCLLEGRGGPGGILHLPPAHRRAAASRQRHVADAPPWIPPSQRRLPPNRRSSGSSRQRAHNSASLLLAALPPPSPPHRTTTAGPPSSRWSSAPSWTTTRRARRSSPTPPRWPHRTRPSRRTTTRWWP